MKKILGISSVLAILAGILMVVGGAWGIAFTYKNVAREEITTPSDASIPNAQVRGPRTLKSQADIIREHVLKNTDGKTYSQMPQKIEKVDQNGNVVMTTNDARSIWITATTLTTALNLGIVTYVFSGLILFLGLISIWNGIIFCILKKNLKN